MDEPPVDVREEGEQTIRDTVKQMMDDGADRVEMEIMLNEIARDLRHHKIA